LISANDKRISRKENEIVKKNQFRERRGKTFWMSALSFVDGV
jgi:hypothetical protein